MKILKSIILFVLFLSYIPAFSQGLEEIDSKGMNKQLVRIAELEIYPEYWEEYKEILIFEAKESVENEDGVVCIFPMEMKSEDFKIKILEIYANQKAYEDHLKTPHFQYYKSNTLKMVKELKLLDMNALDTQTMQAIFKKRK
ncbi:putative quinol monooxygenase [Sphingobacterium endophyticum]|uniref:putative quinol monooxygenase n=1 Tax=Sphingobacterium endophyticum TaxID=2546448 RepID=UPI001E47FECC|nr:antibiotic biosynthesis monooxygenase family protein [Sphingobacterium endophyticum]